MDAAEQERLLSPEEVARMCSLSRKAVYRAIERGELSAFRLCSRLRVRLTDVQAWIDGNRVDVAVSPLLPAARSTRAPAASGLRTLLSESGTSRR